MIAKRVFVFLDEWLFYILLIYLWKTNEMFWFAVAAGLGTCFVIAGYKGLWELEDRRFGPP